MTIHECGYCSYKGEEDSVRGHLLSSHDVNAFEDPLWRHADPVEDEQADNLPHDDRDMTLQEFMDDHEENQNTATVSGSTSLYGRFMKGLKSVFNE